MTFAWLLFFYNRIENTWKSLEILQLQANGATMITRPFRNPKNGARVNWIDLERNISTFQSLKKCLTKMLRELTDLSLLFFLTKVSVRSSQIIFFRCTVCVEVWKICLLNKAILKLVYHCLHSYWLNFLCLLKFLLVNPFTLLLTKWRLHDFYFGILSSCL